MERKILGNKEKFAIEYYFHNEEHSTELSLYVENKNILAFTMYGKETTTCWNLDELVQWLRDFIDNMKEDPYPVEICEQYGAIKDDIAREKDFEDEDEFDKYYDMLDEWCFRHRWHPASAGGILADVYFQQVGEFVEISWNNKYMEDYVDYKYVIGGVCIPKEEFVSVVVGFINDYADNWF